MADAGDSGSAPERRVTPSAVGLVKDLAAVASRFSPDARAEKRRLLAALVTERITEAPALVQLHETLCFLQAYPDELVRTIRAKGARGEGPYVRRLLAHARLRRALEALVRQARPGPRPGAPS